jgi:hypothetical protein
VYNFAKCNISGYPPSCEILTKGPRHPCHRYECQPLSSTSTTTPRLTLLDLSSATSSTINLTSSTTNLTSSTTNPTLPTTNPELTRNVPSSTTNPALSTTFPTSQRNATIIPVFVAVGPLMQVIYLELIFNFVNSS